MNIELSSTGAAYIRYSTSASVENLYLGGDENSDVIVDLDEHGMVVGIEIVDVSIEEDVAGARAFAAERGLPFPRDLAAAARDVSARLNPAPAVQASRAGQALDAALVLRLLNR